MFSPLFHMKHSDILFTMSGKIISIVNQKGGVGKTTTAINLASYLSEKNKKVLLLDLDPQGNCTSGSGIDDTQIEGTIYDLLMGTESLKECVYPTPFKNLHILPSNRHLAGAEVELVNLVSRETLLKDKIHPLLQYYDYIIIDCPPSLGLLTINALVASHKTIIPLQCEYYALEGLANLLNTIEMIKEAYNPDLSIGGILLTMFDIRTSLNKEVALNAKKHFKDLMFKTIIPRNIRLTEAPSHGLPIALYNPQSKGAAAYNHLAMEVIKRV